MVFRRYQQQTRRRFIRKLGKESKDQYDQMDRANRKKDLTTKKKQGNKGIESVFKVKFADSSKIRR